MMTTTTESKKETRRGPVIIEGTDEQLRELLRLLADERQDHRRVLEQYQRMIERQAAEINRLKARRLAS